MRKREQYKRCSVVMERVKMEYYQGQMSEKHYEKSKAVWIYGKNKFNKTILWEKPKGSKHQ